MTDLEIDETLPGDNYEDEDREDEIRRVGSAESVPSTSYADDSTDVTNSFLSEDKEESLRGWLYLIAGAGYGLLVVYLLLVIWMGYSLPLLSEGDIEDTTGALTTALLISAMVYVTIWFFMSGKKHSYFTEDPDKAKFYAGIIGLAAVVIIALSWSDYSREMVVSAILAAVSTWSYIRSSQMKS